MLKEVEGLGQSEGRSMNGLANDRAPSLLHYMLRDGLLSFAPLLFVSLCGLG